MHEKTRFSYIFMHENLGSFSIFMHLLGFAGVGFAGGEGQRGNGYGGGEG